MTCFFNTFLILNFTNLLKISSYYYIFMEKIKVFLELNKKVQKFLEEY